MNNSLEFRKFFPVPKRKKKNAKFVIGPGDPNKNQNMPRGYDGRGYASGVTPENGNVVGFAVTPVATAGGGVGDGAAGGMGESVSVVPLENKPDQPIYKYGCFLCNLNDSISQYLYEMCRKDIPEDDLYTDSDCGIDGIERNHHVSLLYGVEEDDVNQLEPIISPICSKLPEIRLGKINRFTENPDFDVIVINVNNKINEINTELSNQVKHCNVFDEYKPHVTLAYVKKGCCEELDNDLRFCGLIDKPNNICFADRFGEQTQFSYE